jgi:thiol-disulfide isomerase/thioredoxin
LEHQFTCDLTSHHTMIRGNTNIKMNKFIRLIFLCLSCLLIFLSCSAPVYTAIGTPKIQAGTAKITGRIISPNERHKYNSVVNIYVPHPISGEVTQYNADLDKSGKFSIDVDVETDISMVGINTSLKPGNPILLKVKSGNATDIEITYNLNFDIEDVQTKPEMSKYEMMQSITIIGEMIDMHGVSTPLYNKPPSNFLNEAKISLNRRLLILQKDSLISKELKELLARDFKIWMYSVHVFDYHSSMKMNIRNTLKDSTVIPIIQNIDTSYYKFLREFNLNDPQYLICSSFTEFQKEILQNEIIALPKIGDNDIPSWLASAKALLSNLVGFKDGPYYDILVANSYGRQLNEEVKPLTDKQRNNIAAYWKEGEIAKILLRKNKQVVELNKFKTAASVVDISSVSNDKVIETIRGKHKGKAVFIDLWATWCSPCLDAMQQFRSTKNSFIDKDVVFVYLTNGSSPLKLWEEKIKGIGNEHYYLSASQWEYIMKQFQFKYIPSYVLYNKEGILTNKFSAFPGSKEVGKMIDGVL